MSYSLQIIYTLILENNKSKCQLNVILIVSEYFKLRIKIYGLIRIRYLINDQVWLHIYVVCMGIENIIIQIQFYHVLITFCRNSQERDQEYNFWRALTWVVDFSHNNLGQFSYDWFFRFIKSHIIGMSRKSQWTS